MDNAMQLGYGPAVGRARLRIASVVTAIALVFAMFVLVQDRAEAAPSGASVAAAVALPSVDSAAQVDTAALIRAIVCPILLRLATGPFAAFIAPIIVQLQVRFGCIISPGAGSGVSGPSGGTS